MSADPKAGMFGRISPEEHQQAATLPEEGQRLYTQFRYEGLSHKQAWYATQECLASTPDLRRIPLSEVPR